MTLSPNPAQPRCAVRRPVVPVGFRGGATFGGRRAGMPVLIAQGDADQMISAEFQTRTWEYLHGESGAHVVARRFCGGHPITNGDVEALADWIGSTV